MEVGKIERKNGGRKDIILISFQSGFRKRLVILLFAHVYRSYAVL